MKKWRCTVCGYVYDPAKGDPEHGVPAGTSFADLPDGWTCPVCGVGPELFEAEGETGDTARKEEEASPEGVSSTISVGQQDPRATKLALFKMSYGLYIVTSLKGDKINGQSANTVFQVTSEPIQIAIGINKSNLTHEYIQESGIVGITILGEDGHDLVRRFGYSSGRDKDKFAGVDYVKGIAGAPIVKGGIAFLEGKILREKSIDAGTHTLFVAEVTDGGVTEDREPMTYAYFRKTK